MAWTLERGLQSAETRAAYPKGARVRMRDEALRGMKRRTGIVVGYGRDTGMIRVRRDGLQAVEVLAARFWKVTTGE